MQNKDVAVRLENITKYYVEGNYKLELYDNLSVDFYRGCISLIVGRSGSGKSTLLNLISGIDTPNSGDVYIDNINLSVLHEDERTLFRRKNIGIVFQFFHLINTLTVMDNIALPLELNGIIDSECISRAEELLDKIGLKNKALTYPDTLSGGEQQRVAIARAIAHNPKVIIADEPTGNLDSTNSNMIVELLFKLAKDKGQTLIMATHSRDLIDLSDSSYLVDNLGLQNIR